MYDVLVVGAGPSGAYCAWRLSCLRRDLNIGLIDRKASMSFTKPDAGGIAAIWLGRLGIAPDPGFLAASIMKASFVSPGGMEWSTETKEPMGYVLHRDRFDSWLAERAESQGVHVILNCEALKILDGCVETSRGPINARSIVIADGFPSRLGVQAGFYDMLAFKKDDIHIGYQETISPSPDGADEIVLYLGNEFAPGGYAWSFPCGSGRARVGIGVPLSIGHPRERYARFLSRHAKYEQEVQLRGAHMIPTALPLRSYNMGSVWAVGDAALCADPLTGGGIAFGMLSGGHAAQAIASGDARLYENLMRRDISKRNRKRYRLKRFLTSLNDRELDELCLALKGFSVSVFDPDVETKRLVLHLLKQLGTNIAKKLLKSRFL